MEYLSKEELINKKKLSRISHDKQTTLTKTKDVKPPVVIMKKLNIPCIQQEEQEQQLKYEPKIIKGNDCIEKSNTCVFKDSLFHCLDNTSKVNICIHCFGIFEKSDKNALSRKYNLPCYYLPFNCHICTRQQCEYTVFGSVYLCEHHKEEFGPHY